VSGTYLSLLGVSFYDANIGVAVGGGYDSQLQHDVGLILRTTNGGGTWVQQESGLTTYLRTISFTDANTWTASAQWGGVLLHTTNAGAVWTQQDIGNMNCVTGVAVPAAPAGFAAGYRQVPCGGHCGYNLFEVYRTTDGGATWTEMPMSPRVCTPNAVSFTSASTGTVVGWSGLILRTTTGGAEWIRENPPVTQNAPTELELLQNYPNPFNPTTNIRYQIADSRFVKITIYDILGREVEVLVNERKAPGRYTVEFCGCGLASGVYFYRLEARPVDGRGGRTSSETKKLLLLR